ncbi:MAG: monofunctional biosynthetic peptidoglycan transglycosylase [Deltaproteobacteria bacterium]|nr:monofunctional biosynthetic peptidoglycan transglycosylase [Deltaproteobacteria bacterium]
MKKITYISAISVIILTILFIVTLPDVSRLKKENPKKSSLMEYRESEWAAKGKKRKAYQVWVPYSRISPYVAKAIIIAEDDKFWSHEGFDYEAIQKAIEKDLKAKKFKVGGSTISQQLAKNLYLTPRKNPIRKLREAAITWKIERTLSKKRILELYLNVVEWGDGIFGIEAASRHHFGKPASDLTAMEAARLAAVLPNPRRFDASGDQRFVNSRSNLIYSIMIRRGIVVPELDEVNAEIQGQEASDAQTPSQAEPAQETVPQEQPKEPAQPE